MALRRDTQTLDLFAIPEPAPLPASHDFRAVVSHLVADALKQHPADRYDAAAKISRLAGRDVSKFMLDAYASEAREEFNMPLYLVAAFEAALGTHALTNWLTSVRGGRLFIGCESLTAELGRLEQIRDNATKKIRELKRRMGEVS